MKFQNYLNESFEKIFIRIGPGSGQKQTHKSWKQAPEKKGIWLLPIQGAKDLAFLGSGSGYLKNPRLFIMKKDREEYDKLEKELDTTNFKNAGKIMDKMDKLEMKSFKLNYKKFKLKPNEMIWCHIGKGAPDKTNGEWDWYHVSVSEYWDLFKRAYAKQVGGERRSGTWKYLQPDWELFEIFYKTT